MLERTGKISRLRPPTVDEIRTAPTSSLLPVSLWSLQA